MPTATRAGTSGCAATCESTLAVAPLARGLLPWLVVRVARSRTYCPVRQHCVGLGACTATCLLARVASTRGAGSNPAMAYLRPVLVPGARGPLAGLANGGRAVALRVPNRVGCRCARAVGRCGWRGVGRCWRGAVPPGNWGQVRAPSLVRPYTPYASSSCDLAMQAGWREIVGALPLACVVLLSEYSKKTPCLQVFLGGPNLAYPQGVYSVPG